MRTLATGTALLAMLVSNLPALAQDSTIQRSFSGHTVHLELSSGKYRVNGSADGRIRVIPRTGSHPLNVRLDVNTFGSEATVKVTGPSGESTIDIELPSRVDLVVTVRGASLNLRGIAGSKNITGDSGQIEIAMGDPDRYDRVSATVRTGTVLVPRARASSDQRSFEWTGRGSDTLTVKLNQGNIALVD